MGGHDHSYGTSQGGCDPDDVECREVLEEVYLFLDGERTAHDRHAIQQHLDDCTPCLRKYGIEREVKALVARCCGQEETPAHLRDRVLVALRSTTVVSDGATTTVTSVEVTRTV